MSAGTTKLRYSGIGANYSTGAVYLAYIAYFPSTTNASVAYVIKGFAPSNAWYCLAWCAMAGNSSWELSERKVPSMLYLDNYYAFPRSDATLSSRGTSITQTFGRYGASPVSSAASGLTPFPMSSPMSIDADYPR